MSKKFNMQDAEREIIHRLNILDEYRSFGVSIVGAVRSSGKAECLSAFREETKPSAWIDVNSGLYGDSGSNLKAMSIWEFAAQKGKFATWQDARKHFADKTGVKISAAKQEENPLDQLEFMDWHAGHDTLADIWCRKHKKGATLEALKLAGGRIGRYPCRLDKESGQRKRGEFSVISLPCYGEKLLDANPVAWVIWNLGGGTLPVYRGKGQAPDQVKMKSIGATRGTMMNLHALATLADETRSGDVELIYKSGGPSDMLAIQSAILRDAPDLLYKHLVLTNASSETGDILPHQAGLFAGRKSILVHDADDAGEMGRVKWQVALAPVASELRAIKLPYQVQKKHGKDARDFLNGVSAEIVLGAT